MKLSGFYSFLALLLILCFLIIAFHERWHYLGVMAQISPCTTRQFTRIRSIICYFTFYLLLVLILFVIEKPDGISAFELAFMLPLLRFKAKGMPGLFIQFLVWLYFSSFLISIFFKIDHIWPKERR